MLRLRFPQKSCRISKLSVAKIVDFRIKLYSSSSGIENFNKTLEVRPEIPIPSLKPSDPPHPIIESTKPTGSIVEGKNTISKHSKFRIFINNTKNFVRYFIVGVIFTGMVLFYFKLQIMDFEYALFKGIKSIRKSKLPEELQVEYLDAVHKFQQEILDRRKQLQVSKDEEDFYNIDDVDDHSHHTVTTGSVDLKKQPFWTATLLQAKRYWNRVLRNSAAQYNDFCDWKLQKEDMKIKEHIEEGVRKQFDLPYNAKVEINSFKRVKE